MKLAGPQLVQMFIGDGAKLVRDAFALAKEKAPSIIFIDELDAIGTKRYIFWRSFMKHEQLKTGCTFLNGACLLVFLVEKCEDHSMNMLEKCLCIY